MMVTRIETAGSFHSQLGSVQSQVAGFPSGGATCGPAFAGIAPARSSSNGNGVAGENVDSSGAFAAGPPAAECGNDKGVRNDVSAATPSASAFASFVGVDLHKCTVTLVAADPAGDTIGRLTIDTKCVQRIEAWLRARPRPCRMAVEAVGFVEWFIDRFRSCVDRIDIADATELACRRGKHRHNDFNDARDIARRLARGDCPLGFIADDELMQLRKLGRHWRSLSRMLCRAKHCMKSMLNAANLRGPKLDGAGAQRWLLANGHRLKEVQRRAFADYLDIVQLIERQRQPLRREIIFANRTERFASTVQRLQSVPGIDEIWGCIIAAEIGPFGRFPNADALEFWSGLTADLKESAGRTQSGHITKAGSATLRWALGKAALCLCRSDGRQEAIRQRLLRRIGKPKANVAMARRLLRTLYAMQRDQKDYILREPVAEPQAANRAKARARARRFFAQAGPRPQEVTIE